ncbi:hypothetical protein AB0K92_01575 [Streptomyces sp. NPDC052687]|uniref:hypothetical protein n=1 Tax=Streptomyces sp. NPDC052687 TaxID=3154759 RepID=UPI003438D5A8
MNRNGSNGINGKGDGGDDSGWNAVHGGGTDRVSVCAVPDDDLGWPRRRGGRNAGRRGD